MHLYDTLQVCLLAVDSRYSENTVEINSRVLGLPETEQDAWTALEVIEILQNLAPHLLEMMAQLTIDEQQCAIYVPDLSEQESACTLHCRGRIPKHTGNLGTWKQQHDHHPASIPQEVHTLEIIS